LRIPRKMPGRRTLRRVVDSDAGSENGFTLWVPNLIPLPGQLLNCPTCYHKWPFLWYVVRLLFEFPRCK
jgi:hypothetical protein